MAKEARRQAWTGREAGEQDEAPDRQPIIGAAWAAANSLLMGILFFVVVVERTLVKASP